MRIEDIKQQNEKYYYCEDYIWLLREACIIPFLFVGIMTSVSCWIRKLFLTEYFFQQSAEQELGMTDVMYWVNEKVAESAWDFMNIMIIVIGALVAVAMLYSYLGVKSYNLYKMGWLKSIPIILYVIEILVMYYQYHSTNLNLLMGAVIINLASAILSSGLLYRLDTRPGAKGELGLNFLFEFLEKFIIQRL